jgi:hypothetical protein
MSSKTEVYEKHMQRLKAGILQRYEQQGRRASGKFADELEVQVSETNAVLLGSPHSRFVERGRGPGKWPPRAAIEQWIEDKDGLPAIFKEKKKSFAFLIARKIAREGTQGSDVLETAVREFLEKELPLMLSEVGAVYANEIRTELVDFLKKQN